MMTRRLGRAAVAVTVTVLAVVLGGCTGDEDSSFGRLTAEGRTEIGGSERGDWRPVTGTVDVKAGDHVRVIDGVATIAFGKERQVMLRRGTEVELGAVNGNAEVRPTLVTGDLLVEAPTDELTVGMGESSVEVSRGAARLSRGLTVFVGSYSGVATITSAGRELVIPALHQATAPGVGLLPTRPSPLSYTAGDPWDERFLGDAIQLGDELAARSRGFTAQLRQDEELDAGFYRRLLPSLETQPEIDAAIPSATNATRAAGETLVGLAITAEGTRGSFLERLQRVFSFHDEGASWGIVALDQGVDRVKILGTVDEAIRRGPALPAEESVVVSPSPSRSPDPSSQRPPAPTEPSGSDQAAVASPGSQSPSPSPSPSPPLPSSGPLRSGIPAVDGTANNLVDVLSGLLEALGR